MNLNKNMIIAVFLRHNPCFKLEENDTIYWYDPNTKLYYWCKPNSERYKKIYIARGLEQWYYKYLKLLHIELKGD